ncbi:MAG: hypothetical protein ACPL7K_03440 [Armatimonadota bacterium]
MLALLRRSFMILAAASIAALGAQLATHASSGSESTQQQLSSPPIYPLPASSTDPTAIASMKQLPDGATVCVYRKCVTRAYLDDLYIEEADRSAGIKVIYSGHYPPAELEPGNLVTFSGVLGTIGAERVIYARSDFECDLTTSTRIMPLGMTTAAILGWPIDPRQPDGPRRLGLNPTGLLVKISGRVTATYWSDEEGYFVYIDDGYGKKDGSDIGAPGVRVYYTFWPSLGQFLVATGVLGSKIYDPNPGIPGDEVAIPVIRCHNNEEPYFPSFEPQPRSSGQVSGFVRLVGEPAPGKQVRIYSQNASVLVPNVTDDYTPFTIHNIPPIDPGHTPPLFGGLITASAHGYVSDSRAAGSGQTDVVFELLPSPVFMEIKTDKESIAICSPEHAVISAMLRDCEGKGISGRQIKLTT